MSDHPNNESTQLDDKNSQIAINIQYLKDLSFESPNAPMSLTAMKEQPQVDLNLDLATKPLQENVYEVAINIKASIKVDNLNIFVVDLTYAGVFSLINIPADQVEPLLLVHCPNILFPFARRILADVTRDGGFQPLMVDPVDFYSLYQNKKASLDLEQQKPH